MMSRYRPPRQLAAAYITAEGYQTLRDELGSSMKKRREIVVHLSAAADEGDRSENAEYIYRKKQLRELDRRIGYLERRIPNLKVVSTTPGRGEKAYFGAYVTLYDGSDSPHRYRIVGADESDPARDLISVDSTVARALLGREVGDKVEVDTPRGKLSYSIVKIEY